MSITGNLRTLEFAELLQWLSQGQKTGCLVITNASTEKRIFFKAGKIVSTESNNPEEHLGKYMVREGLLDQETLSRALKLQESTQILLGKVLVTLGTISEEELRRILRQKTEESLYGLFTWTEGDFRFLPGEQPKLPMVSLEIDVTNVVLEGAKRLDEARRDGRENGLDYSDEIENVLSADIFHGSEISDTADDTIDAQADEQSVESLAPTDESSVPKDTSTEVRGYYSGAVPTKRGRTPLLVVAASLMAIGIGVSAYFILRPEPTVGYDRQTSSSSTAVTGSEDAVELEADALGDPYVDGTTGPDAPSFATDVSVATAENEDDDEAAALQARYEAELETLKKQLQQAKLAAAERDEALGRVAELEEQVALAQESTPVEIPAAKPEAKFTVASLQNPLETPAFTAGGDELPPFVAPQPTTEADQEAGSEFAAEMVESAAASAPPQEQRPVPAEVEEEQPDPPTQQAAKQAAAQQVSPPVMLSLPNPRYPMAAIRLGKEATVTLRLLIGATGKVVDVERVGDEQGLGFDKAAINAALRTEWQPATIDGEPVEMWTEIRIAFKP